MGGGPVVPGEQDRRNDDVWRRGDSVGRYSTEQLRPVEAVILERYRDELAGTVLELGCGGGRLSGHLVRVAARMYGIDLAPAMVEHCRRAYPAGIFSVCDLKDLSAFRDAGLEAVFAPFNVLDVLSDPERTRVLADIRGLLGERGTIVFSSHNLAHADRIPPPGALRFDSAKALAASILRRRTRIRNHRELAPLQSRGAGHAIVNDQAHDYSLLHYYISPAAQRTQLAQAGFELVECLDLDGRTMQEGQAAAECPELHYVARVADGGSSARPSATEHS